MEKKVTSSVMMGLMVALILIVISLVTYFTGVYTQSWNQYVGFVVLCAAIIICVVIHAKEVDYRATFGNLFGFGFKVVATATCIMILYVIVSGFIFPDVKTKIMEVAREQALKQPGANADQVEKGMEFFEKNFTLFVILGILFWYLVIGAVASLIGAAVSKKRPAQDFDNI